MLPHDPVGDETVQKIGVVLGPSYLAWRQEVEALSHDPIAYIATRVSAARAKPGAQPGSALAAKRKRWWKKRGN